MDKITLPDWVGDDWEPEAGQEVKDLETMIIILMKKTNEIIDWINKQ